MRALTALLMVVVFLSAAPVRAVADVGDFVGRPIASVTIEQSGRRITDPRMLELVRTQPGDPLSLAAVRESVTHLFSLGRYDDVRVRAAGTANGIAIVYELVPRSEVTQIVFRGADGDGIDVGRLRNTIVDRFGASPSPGQTQEMASGVIEELRRVGYLDATVSASVQSGATTMLVFDVIPGARVHVRNVEVTGDAGLSARQLLQRLRLAPGVPLEREQIATRIERVLQERRSRGFLTAQLSFAVEPVGPGLVDVTVAAVRGLPVRIVFEGDPIPEGRRDELVPVEREGSADEDLLEDSGLRIEDYLRAQGHRYASVTYRREEVDGELRITFDVRRGPQYRVARINLAGMTAAAPPEVATVRRVQEGQPFSEAALNADLSAIEEVYRRSGFAAVVVTSTLDLGAETVQRQVPVTVTITVTENARTLIRSVAIEGATIPTAGLLAGLGLQAGRPFYLTQLAIDRDAIQLHYANRGYQTVAVATNPGLSPDGRQADVVFQVREGPQLFVDHVLIVGNERTRSSTIERELQVKPGDPLGLEAINESQRRLAALGLFRRARISEIGHGDENRRDVLVSVEEAPATTLGYGGGLEAREQLQQQVGGAALEQLQFAPRAFFEIGRRNLFGKNRSINLFTRISLRPPREGQTERLREYRVIGTFREPRALGLGADAFLTGSLEQQQRASFNFSRRALNAGVGRRLTQRVSLSGSYQIQRTELFDEQIDPSQKLLIDRAFPQVRLSSFSLSAVRDDRDDLTDPRRGRFLSANGQLAGRKIGSEVGFAKTYLTAQTFREVRQVRNAVIAASARLGMAAGFPRVVATTDEAGNPVVGADGMPVNAVVRDLPASERFFAGGDTTVRGFALDQLGRPDTLDQDGFPNGGLGLVILNGELRVPVRGGLGVVGFVDAGNVFAKTSDIDLGQLRTTVGFGVRYRSPIGPIRFDIGFKTRRNELKPGTLEPGNSVHISLGQAF